jgi:DNA-binding response OmpR family regulator
VCGGQLARCILRQRVLLVAAEVKIRARVARHLIAFGYAVELAGDDMRALALARADKFLVAIVALGARRGSLAMLGELRDWVSKLIIFAELPKEIARLQRSFPEADVVLLKKCGAFHHRRQCGSAFRYRGWRDLRLR